MVHGEIKIQSFTSYHIKYITYKMFHTKACILYTLYTHLIMKYDNSFIWSMFTVKWKKPKTNLSNNFHYSPFTHINEGAGKYNL